MGRTLTPPRRASADRQGGSLEGERPIMKLKITATRAYTYPGQTNPQGRFFEIDSDGLVEVDVNPEIGNGIPSKVWNGELRRFAIPHGMTRAQIIEFYRANRTDFQVLVSGLSVKWDGSNHVGVLTDVAQEAEDRLAANIYSWQ